MSCSCCNCIPCSCNTLNALPSCPVSVGCIPAVCVPETSCVCGGAAKVFEDVDGFVLPVVDGGLPVSVKCTDDWLVGCCVIIKDVNETAFMKIASIDSDNGNLFLVNVGAEGNPSPGYAFVDPTKIFLFGPCPDVAAPTDDCEPLKVDVSEAFTVPLVGASVNITIDRCLEVKVGQQLFIEGLGTVSIVSISSNDPFAILEVSPTCLLPGVTEGVTAIPAGSYVTNSNICVVTDGTINGTGTLGDPLSVGGIENQSFLVEDTGSAGAGTAEALTTFAGVFSIPATDLSITGNVGTPMTFANTKYDIGSNFNVGRDGYVVPEDGEYVFYVSLELEASADGAAALLPADTYIGGIYRFTAGGEVFSLASLGHGGTYATNVAKEDLSIGAYAQEELVAGDVIKTGIRRASATVSVHYAETRYFGGRLIRRI